MSSFKLTKINPCEKTYCFFLTSETCYALKANGKCSLYLSEEEAQDIHKSENSASGSSVMRCRNLAESLLASNYFDDPEPQKKIFKIQMIKRACGHYVFADGQHRTCIAKHLNIRSMYLRLYNETDHVDCPYCIRDSSFQESLIGKLKNRFLRKKKVKYQFGAPVIDNLHMPSHQIKSF